PNENKSPSEFDVKRVLHQVKYLGLCENIRIRRAGFAYRQTFEKFVERFYLLSSQTSYAGDFIWTGGSKEACIQILKDTDIKSEEWQIGTTKVFIRHPEVIWGLETMRERYWHGMAQRIQTAWRKYQAFRAAKATKIQRVWRQKRQAFELIKFREHGDGLLGGKKERRRFSICSLRTFNGDYLMVNSRDKHTRGFLLREAAQIGSEPAVFSSRIEFLVPRAMRSARPMPRQLVVTKDHVCIVEEKVVDGLVQHALVSKIDVAAIKDLAMSPYQDGWTVVHLMSQPDLVFNCEFKTEMLTWLNSVSQGRIHLQVNSTISYNNKNMKSTQIKFVKNEAVQRAVFEKKTVQHPRHKALFDFSDANSGMLSLEAGQLYEVLEKNDSGWWLGSRNGVEGWIPSNYLSPEPEAASHQAPHAPVIPPPMAMRNNPTGDVDNQQLDSMAQLAAALASRSPSNNVTPTSEKGHVPARPGMNRFAQEDSDEEEAWE
ncbi:class II myosin, partial [Coemansia sp. RSA 451]